MSSHTIKTNRREECSAILKEISSGAGAALRKVPESEIRITKPFDSLFDPIPFPQQDLSIDTTQLGSLFIGPLSSALSRNHDALKASGICAVVSLTVLPEHEKMREGMDYYFFDAQDTLSFPIGPYFTPTFDIIDEYIRSGKHVLVHCSMGVSRSGAIVVAYLMQKFALGRNDALLLAKKGRSCIQPNDSFMEELQQLETSLER